MAKLSVSALVVDYILTGPISSVSAGQYLGTLLNELSDLAHLDFHVPPNLFAAVFRRRRDRVLLVGEYQGNSRIVSGKALRIMQITTVMVVILLIWCPLTLLIARQRSNSPRLRT